LLQQRFAATLPALANCNERRRASASAWAPRSRTCYAQRAPPRAATWTTIKYLLGATGIGLGTTTKFLRRTTRAAAGNGLGTTINYLRRTTSGAACDLGNTIKYLRRTTKGAAGSSLGTTIKYLRRSTSSAAGICLYTAIKYLGGAAGIGLGTTIKYLRRATNAAAGNGLGTATKYLVNQNMGAGNNWAKAHYTEAVHELC
jgi:hypothetical protein